MIGLIEVCMLQLEIKSGTAPYQVILYKSLQFHDVLLVKNENQAATTGQP